MTRKARPSKTPKLAKNSTDVRRKLLLAGKKMFARKGLSGTTIRDIANEARVNSSMISYYFSGKEGLYRDCLREIGETRLAFAKQALNAPNSLEEFTLRLRLFTENLFALYLEDRDAGLIVVREYDRSNSPAEKVFKDTFLKIFEVLKDYFKSAQKKGFLAKRQDSFVLASLFFGCAISQMRLDHIKNKSFQRSLTQEKEHKKVLDHMIQLFVQNA